jgi:hypothetical protein
MKSRYGEPWMHEIAAAFVEFPPQSAAASHERGGRLGRRASGVTAPIIGARSARAAPASLDSVKIDMTPELRGRNLRLSRTGPRRPPTVLEEIPPKP